VKILRELAEHTYTPSLFILLLDDDSTNISIEDQHFPVSSGDRASLRLPNAYLDGIE